jgi:hypothetical protein
LEYLLEDIGKEAGLNKHLSFDMCRWTCALDNWNLAWKQKKFARGLASRNPMARGQHEITPAFREQPVPSEAGNS